MRCNLSSYKSHVSYGAVVRKKELWLCSATKTLHQQKSHKRRNATTKTPCKKYDYTALDGHLEYLQPSSWCGLPEQDKSSDMEQQPPFGNRKYSNTLPQKRGGDTKSTGTSYNLGKVWTTYVWMTRPSLIPQQLCNQERGIMINNSILHKNFETYQKKAGVIISKG